MTKYNYEGNKPLINVDAVAKRCARQVLNDVERSIRDGVEACLLAEIPTISKTPYASFEGNGNLFVSLAEGQEIDCVIKWKQFVGCQLRQDDEVIKKLLPKLKRLVTQWERKVKL